MNNSGQVFLLFFILIISVATGYWFYNNFSWVEKEEEIGFLGVAKTNKLLAADFFLRKMGIHSQQVNSLIAFRNLPSPQTAILIATQRETFNKELSQKILKWVRSGGHVIVEARFLSRKAMENLQFPKDHLLEKFAIYSLKNDVNEDNKDIPVRVSLKNEENNFYQSLPQKKDIEVNFPYQRILYRVSKHSQQHAPEAMEQPVWRVKDELGSYLMQFSLGQGLLTVLASTSMFNNEQIAENEHARLLHHLVQQQGHRGGVWLIRSDDMPALWKWLWDNVRTVLICLMILFFLWLWRISMRFGPQLNDVKTERRSLLEHIQASGNYRWHESQSGFLLTQVQEALWEKIHSSHPVIRRENLLQAYAMLEEITGINASLIKQALTTEKSINEQEFTRKVRLLDFIRKQL